VTGELLADSRPVVVRARGLAKRWDATSGLAPVSFSVHAGEMVVVRGRSGSGKSTLLALLAGWCDPDAGTLERVGSWARDDSWWRWSGTGVVPQVLSPIAELSVGENTELPLRLAGTSRDDTGPLALAVLTALDLDELAGRAATETSMGQQQRLAVARAAVARPVLLLADEPTSHQDAHHARMVLEALRACARAGSAVVVATHEELVLAAADRVVDLDDEAVLSATSTGLDAGEREE
jgi:putative ABC transport system ATP-binding protein